MLYNRPRPGQELDLIDRADIWSDIVDLINAYKTGRLDPVGYEPDRERLIHLENTSGYDRMAGVLQQIDPFTEPDEATEDLFIESPVGETSDPVWHTAIDNLVVVPSDVLENGVFSYPSLSWAVVVVTDQVDVDDRWVMVDPAEPTKMKTADAGIYRIIGYVGEGEDTEKRAIVDLTQSQTLWRYELTDDSNAPDATDAKLLRLDGTEFSSGSVTEISDPDGLMDDQVAGDKGFCIHAGNKFYAQTAVC